MAVTPGFAMFVNQYPNGIDHTQRRIIVGGNLVPFDSTAGIGTPLKITQVAQTTTTLTITAANSLTTGGGDTVYLFGLTGTASKFNGQWTTASATATTFTITVASGTIAATKVSGPYAIVTTTAVYATGGLPIVAFYDALTGKPTVIAEIGPNAVVAPARLQVFTLRGQNASNGALNYTVNNNVSPNLVLQFTGITQSTNAAVLAADAIGFKGEWIKGAF